MSTVIHAHARILRDYLVWHPLADTTCPAAHLTYNTESRTSVNAYENPQPILTVNTLHRQTKA